MSTPQIAIVGAGFGGLAAAIELKRAGIETFTVFERAGEVGGVWQANSYPGAACDVPSVTYQFSFALNGSWSRRYGTQAEIRDYLRDVSFDFGVRGHIRFNTSVESATFDEQSGRWTLEVSGGESAEFDILICANGQLSRPKIPDVPGLDSFAGEQFHSAEWDHDVDLTGKRVAVVGGGATAIQVVPAIADQASHLTVVQRTPSWVVNKWDWSPVWLERLKPLQRLYHNATWLWFEVRYPGVLRASRPFRALWERERKRTMKRILRDPQKVAAVTPDYQMGCNRLLLSRDWYPTLARDDVSVIGEGVSAVTETGLITSGGQAVDADVIIWCTGFTASEYLAPMAVTGRGGVQIREAWEDGPEAYLGMTTPGFPNMFMVYGPNTNSLTNTIVYLLERQADYIRQAVEYLTARGGTIEVRKDVHDEFNAELAKRFERTTFTTGCPGWYTTSSGKVVAVWVGSHVEYGRRTRHFDPGVFERAAACTPSASSVQ
jgi:cation diffusion facilitator CzcD-associated flavoprotein CzcO